MTHLDPQFLLSYQALAVFFGAYILGSIPFGLLFSHLFGIGDLREHGSGNIGTTNMVRAGGKKLGALTFVFDFGKGLAPMLLTSYFLAPQLIILAGLGAVIGHIFPIWLKFKGGKGVATAAGVMFGVSWALGLITLGIWLLVFAYTRLSSLAAITALGIGPLAAYFLEGIGITVMVLCITVIALARHRENIQRLLLGTESRINLTSDKSEDL